MLIGPIEERWDLCFIAQYPSVAAFVTMIRDPVYREAVGHRQAAVEDSRLVRLAPGAARSGLRLNSMKTMNATETDGLLPPPEASVRPDL